MIKNLALALGAACLWTVAAHAQISTPDVPTGKAAPPEPEVRPWAAPATFGEWASGIKYGFQAEGGYLASAQSPRSQRNFGQLFTDRTNRPILNQLLGTVSRDLDPKATGYEFGFKLQLMYGSDARIVHELGVFDQAIHDRLQLDVVEANALAHLPWLTEGGIDVKAGIYPTPLGFEVIDPKTNPFYTHSYIFNYGLPFKHTGVLTTTHVSPAVDLYFGLDTGTNTTFAGGDNNDRPGGIAGVGLNLGKLTVLALTHIGPENATRNTTFGNSANRYFNDAVITYKHSDKLSFTTELNYVREEGFKAEAYGVAQYVSYALADTFVLNARAEVYRDNNNFFVSTPRGNRDLANFQRGKDALFITSPRAGTYSEYTVGATYKPVVAGPLQTLLVRPEVRLDKTLNGARSYNDGKDTKVWFFGADIVLGF